MKRTILICDRQHPDQDGEVHGDETIEWDSPDGKQVVDVCVEHAEQFRTFEQELKLWVAASRPAEPGLTPARRPRGDKQRDRLENAALREWARQQGIDLGDRGRIPDELRKRFRDEVGEQARTRWTQLAQDSHDDTDPIEEPVVDHRPTVLR